MRDEYVEGAERLRRLAAAQEPITAVRLRCLDLACNLLPDDCTSSDIVDVLANADEMVQYVLTGIIKHD
jgi:hypothetical protein